jgi:formylmethanofuran dehydrogenase subunit D
MQAVVNVVVFGDIFHDEAKKKSRYSEDYRKLSCQILLDREDMARVGAKDGQNVRVESDVGSIVVAAKSSDDDPHPGLAFMIRSPWSNQLSGDDACDPVSPEFKGIYANVSPSSEILTELSEIFKKIAA